MALPELEYSTLISWFHREGRIYPWSMADDPYAIWISEVMLQQTVVTAAVEHYERWLKRWPDIKSLASAKEEDVLRSWEGLGYATRGKNLWKAARHLAEHGLNELPKTYEALRALPGVGEYTASAVLSFAFGKPYLTLDANLKRVLQRLSGQESWTKTFEQEVRGRFNEILGRYPSRDLNLGLMQLGQLVCTPRKPKCSSCPLESSCLARIRGIQEEIPAKVPRVLVGLETAVAVWKRQNGNEPFFFLARPLQGRFSNLWLLPPFPENRNKLPPIGKEIPLEERVHTYTKYRDLLKPSLMEWNDVKDPPLPEGWIGSWVSSSEAGKMGMASIYRKILENAFLHL